MPSFEYDLRYLQAGLDQLEKYLLAKDLYWTIGVGAPTGETPYPQLTIGGLLLALERARATQRTSQQQAALSEAEHRLAEIRDHWLVAWDKKAAQDFHARLNLWRDFLEDYRNQPSANYDRYAYEVGRRVQLHLLEKSGGEMPAVEMELLRGLDSLLRSVFLPGLFVWDDNLALSFPQQIYWYLYGRLRSELG